MLLYEFLGLSEGLMLLWDTPEQVAEIVEAFEHSLRIFVPDVANAPSPPGLFVLSPDNLDSQVISPESFRAHYVDR